MNINISQQISQKQVLQQRLILTQELQLFLKMIQMNTIELREYLDEQLIENPTLEESDEPKETSDSDSSEDLNFDEFTDGRLFYDSSDVPHYTSRETYDDSGEETTWENRVSDAETLIDHLRWQLKVSELTPEEKKIADIIIGNTNEDGYLETDVKEIALTSLQDEKAKLNESEPGSEPPDLNGLTPDEELLGKVIKVLKHIHTSFDPTGVCARDLKECIAIQALDIGYSENDLLFELIKNHLGDMEIMNTEEIAREMDKPVQEVVEAITAISSLEPRPGRPFFKKDTENYVVPDFYVYKVGNELQLQLNRDFPKVRVSSYYRSLIKKQKTLPPEAKQFIKEKLEAAQRIMKCLDEREAAVRKIITKIIDVQKDFFEHGRNYIKPLILKDVADAVGVHESTVSRITSRRYIETPQGTIKLKTLFSRKIETSHGKEVSFEKVKSIIRGIIANEMLESPYSDDDISKILERRSIKVARRTVAKYRKILKIPSSSQRASNNRKAVNENNSNG